MANPAPIKKGMIKQQMTTNKALVFDQVKFRLYEQHAILLDTHKVYTKQMNKYVVELNWLNKERREVEIRKTDRRVQLNNLMKKMSKDGGKGPFGCAHANVIYDKLMIYNEGMMTPTRDIRRLFK